MVYAVETKIGMAYATASVYQKADRYRPVRAGLLPAVILLVGGSFTTATAKNLLSQKQEAIRWAQNGYCAFLAGYRGYGDGGNWRAPTTISDVNAALAWVKRQAYVDPARVLAWGTSAGGNLAARLGTDGSVVGVIAECAPTNIGDPASEAKVAGWLNNGPGEPYSPINFVGPATKPALLIHGTADATVAYQQSVDYKAALDAVGVPAELWLHPGPHGSIADPVQYEEAWTRKLTFARAKIGS